jgi:ribosomal protein S18 acetylase RimI-like enzyme
MSASTNSSSSTAAQQPAFALRAMTEADLPACHRLSLQLKWPHRLEDWRFLLRVGQGVVLESRLGDQPPAVVGSAMCAHYGERHAAIGMVIVQPGVQGHGLARRLMQQLRQYTGSRIEILNATAAGQPLYAKLGFSAIDTLHQYQGSVVPPLLIPLPPGERVRPLGHSDGARIEALDKLATGMDRSKVLAAIGEAAEGVAIDRDGDMLGFALVRRFGHGRVIGPVVAPDIVRAKALITHWINTYSDAFIRIDVFESGGLGEWLGDIGLTRVGSVVQMSRSEDGTPWRPPAAGVQLFSIINQALG